MKEVCTLAQLERHRLTLVENAKKEIEVDEFQAQECKEVWAPMYNADGKISIPKAQHEHMLKVRKISCKYPWGLAWIGNMRQFLSMFIFKNEHSKL